LVSAETVKQDANLSGEMADIKDWDAAKDLLFIIELRNLYKVEDWYNNDRTTTMKTLRKGKGRNPYTDSEIKFRLKVEVNGETIFSNYPSGSMQPIEE